MSDDIARMNDTVLVAEIRRVRGEVDRSGIHPPAGGEYSRLDDFGVIEERRRVMDALAALTDRYRALNQEMTRRETLRWMAAS